MEINTKQGKIVSGFFWKLMELGSVQVVSFIIQIILARLLVPEEFGMVALVMGFIAIANVFITTGFTSSIIQRKSIDTEILSTIFWLNLFISIALYLVLLISAEWIAVFYNMALIENLIKIQALLLLFGALTSVHNAILIREMNFKKLYKYKILAVFFQGVVGITLALLGYGIWAIVYSNLINTIILSLSLWIVVKWRPQFLFSKSSFKAIFSYSLNIMLLNFFNALFNNIQNIAIAKFFNIESLGYYNRGQQIPYMIMQNIDGTINSVMFPALSEVQSDFEKFLSIYRKALTTSIYIVFPLLIFLMVVSESLIYILFGSKWLESTPYLIITCLICMFWPFSIRVNALNALGRANIALKLNVFTHILTLVLFLITFDFGIYIFILSVFIASLVNFFIGMILSKVVFNYSYKKQMLDILPILALSVFMGLIIYLLGGLLENHYINISIQCIVGVGLYLTCSKLFKIEAFTLLLSTIRKNKV